jgi:hypothetical protein
VKFLSLNHGISVKTFSDRPCLNPCYSTANGDSTALAEDLGIKKLLCSNQKSSFGQICGFWFFFGIKRRLQYVEEGTPGLVQYLQHVSRENDPLSLVRFAFFKQVSEIDRWGGFVSEFFGNRMRAAAQDAAGKQKNR